MIIDLLWKDLNKYMAEIKLNKISFKLTNFKVNNLIETKFIPSKIKTYIKEKIKYKYDIKYNYFNNIIRLEYYSSNNSIQTEVFEIIIRRIIFMMKISNVHKNLNVQIYDTPFKKKFNCNNSHKCGNLNHNNVNSGLSYANNVIIFRKEEYLKLLIHEVIHALDIDYKYETYDDQEPLLNLFNVNTENLLINESYVETWAILINIYLVLFEKKTYKKGKINLDLFKKYLKMEITHGLIQSAKLCNYYNIDNFNEMFYNEKIKNNKLYLDTVNTFSYHIIKTLNLYNIKNFLKNFRDNKYIMKKTYNYNKYIKFIIKYSKTIINDVNIMIKKLKNKNLEDLKMSKIN